MKHTIAPSVKMLVAFILAGGLTTSCTFDVNNPPAEVVKTWVGGIHTLPGSATVSGRRRLAYIIDEHPEEWSVRVEREYLKPGARVPAVIYIHGCQGPSASHVWAVTVNKLGFAFFGPDSFQRTNRVAGCYDKVSYAWRMRMRYEEILYALHQVRSLQWVDQNRLVLMGKSEGGAAVARFSGDGFKAHIILAYDCRSTGGNLAAPSDVAVLNVVGANDPREGLCRIRSKFGGSKSVALPGQGHAMTPRVAGRAVTEFLKECCE